MQADFALDPSTLTHKTRCADSTAPPCGGRSCPAAFQRAEDVQFAAMSRALAMHGGFVCGNAMARRMRLHVAQPISHLAQLIVRRSIVSVTWRGEILVPTFQFSAGSMTVLPVVRRVLAELNGVFDEWEVALWFTTSNSWLSDLIPVDLLEGDPELVCEAARTDRFVVHG